MMLYKIFDIVLISFVAVAFVYATAEEEKGPKYSSQQRVVGRIEKLRTNSMTVRVGDATTTFSFDNKTVFTYGDQQGVASDLKVGDEVLATVQQGKAAEVNGTQRLEGVIEQIDAVKKELIVKVGNQLKKIPFRHFLAFGSEGKAASYMDMKVGDGVFLNVNLGFANQPESPATTKP